MFVADWFGRHNHGIWPLPLRVARVDLPCDGSILFAKHSRHA